MIGHIGIAFSSFWAPLASARSLRIAIAAAFAFVAVVIGCYAMGWLDEHAVRSLRELAIIPGMPVMAAIVSEMALRDGITHRTLLYPLLGPVSRPVLAAVRGVASGLVLAAGTSAVVLVLHAVGEIDITEVPRELSAIFLGSLAYTALFGIVHLWWSRGLITALVLFGIDFSIARLPFAIRAIAPSYHVGAVADIDNTFSIPLIMNLPDASFLGSCLYLIVMVALCNAAVALIFSRKRLGELC